jgi:2-polyprenyl-6-hydroxyphenyl methylase/3-demethylubiquinone-9 3-methyltransferase
VSFFTHLVVIIKYTIKLQPMTAIRPLLRDGRERGMSAKYDVVDWIGGFPYEFATFDTLVEYLTARRFNLINHTRIGSHGCNQLVLQLNDGIS